jgi:hypothetical protein
MIKPFEYKIREDGVKLILKLDVLVEENGDPLLDKHNNPIPTGFKIHKIGTDEFYDEAIDVEGTPFEYEETTIKIDTFIEEQ